MFCLPLPLPGMDGLSRPPMTDSTVLVRLQVLVAGLWSGKRDTVTGNAEITSRKLSLSLSFSLS